MIYKLNGSISLEKFTNQNIHNKTIRTNFYGNSKKKTPPTDNKHQIPK